MTVAGATLLANDRPGPANEAGQVLRIVANGFGTPGHGTVSWDGTNVRYTPEPNYNGIDRFTYTIDDGDPASTAVGTVAVIVTSVNDPPIPGHDTAETAEDAPLTLAASTLLSNDCPGPANESSQTTRIVPGGFGVPAHGTVSYDGVSVVYRPEPDYAGPDAFTYTIDDGFPNSTAVVTVTINVTAVNDLPVAVNDAVTATEDVALTIAATVLTGNDLPGPAAENTQTVRMVANGFGNPAHGTLTYNGTNLVYTPQADYFGTDAFTYTIDDGLPASTAVGTVTVTVLPVNDPPVAGGDAVTTAEDTAATVAVSSCCATTCRDRPTSPASPCGSWPAVSARRLTAR